MWQPLAVRLLDEILCYSFTAIGGLASRTAAGEWPTQTISALPAASLRLVLIWVARLVTLTCSCSTLQLSAVEIRKCVHCCMPGCKGAQ